MRGLDRDLVVSSIEMFLGFLVVFVQESDDAYVVIVSNLLSTRETLERWQVCV